MPRHKKGKAAPLNDNQPQSPDDAILEKALDEEMQQSLNEFLEIWIEYEQEEKYFKEQWREEEEEE